MLTPVSYRSPKPLPPMTHTLSLIVPLFLFSDEAIADVIAMPMSAGVRPDLAETSPVAAYSFVLSSVSARDVMVIPTEAAVPAKPVQKF